MRHILFRILFFLLFSVAFDQVGMTQSTRYRLYNENSGLNRHSIFDLVRDEQDNYWLGTEKGVVRFDGANFTEINPPNTYRLERVQQLYTYKHYLYVIYLRQGCVRLNLRNYTYETITDLPVGGLIHRNDSSVVLLDKQGKLYTYERSVLRPGETIGDPFFSYPMHIQKNTLFLALPKKGVLALDVNTLQLRKNMGGDTLDNHISFTSNGENLFICGNHSLYEVTPKLQLKAKSSLGNRVYEPTFVTFRMPDNLFLIERSKTLYQVVKNKSNPILLRDLENVELRKVLIHDDANILVSTNRGLLHIQTNESPVTRFSDSLLMKNDELRIRRKIIPLGQDDMLLFGYSRNYRYKEGKFKLLSTLIASSYDAIRVGQHVYYTTEDRGLFRYDITQEHSEQILNGPLPDKVPAYAIDYNTHDSSLLLGTARHLYVWSLRTNQTKRISPQLPFDFIQTVFYDSLRHEYWIGTNGGLACLNRSFQTILVIRQIPGSSKTMDVTDIYLQRRTGVLWIAHRYGVLSLNPATRKPSDQLVDKMFENPVVAAILEDQNGKIWLPTFEGLLAYDPQTKAVLRIGSKNNLVNTEYNLKSAAMLPDGRMILGGVTGYDIIDPNQFTFSKSSETGWITGYERLYKDSSVFLTLKNNQSIIDFDIDTESLRLYLAAKNSLTSRFYNYEYQFNEDGWVAMKDASYFNIFKLDPGRYKLQFRAFDEYGTLITFKPININATVVFYKNRYFVWSLLFLTMAMIALVVRLEIRRKKRENSLKEQISMDLHDEVGTILTRALMISNSATIPHRDERVKNYLGEALYSLRVYINTMNRKSFSIIQLTDELKEMVNQTFSGSTYDVKLDLGSDSDVEISSEKYRDMKLCLFEIMNNILKHSQGDLITIRLEITSLLLRFEISDNGKLTSIEQLENKGNGIRNIRKRVKKHKGLANFAISEFGHGLEISLICPK